MNRGILLIAAGLWLGGCVPFSEVANSHCQRLRLQPGTPAFTRCFYETSDHAMASATGQALEAPGVWQWTHPVP